jgi:hypothetical protein
MISDDTITDIMKKIWAKCGLCQMVWRSVNSETAYLALGNIQKSELFQE